MIIRKRKTYLHTITQLVKVKTIIRIPTLPKMSSFQQNSMVTHLLIVIQIIMRLKQSISKLKLKTSLKLTKIKMEIL